MELNVKENVYVKNVGNIVKIFVKILNPKKDLKNDNK